MIMATMEPITGQAPALETSESDLNEDAVLSTLARLQVMHLAVRGEFPEHRFPATHRLI